MLSGFYVCADLGNRLDTIMPPGILRQSERHGRVGMEERPKDLLQPKEYVQQHCPCIDFTSLAINSLRFCLKHMLLVEVGVFFSNCPSMGKYRQQGERQGFAAGPRRERQHTGDSVGRCADVRITLRRRSGMYFVLVCYVRLLHVYPCSVKICSSTTFCP
jgi:hypothetical protein